MQTDEFEQLVVATLESLPPEFRRYLATVECLVASRPTREDRRRLGLKPGEVVYGYYDGIPLTEGSAAFDGPPATIVIFQEPLERDFPDQDELRSQVRRTVLHEVAHHFGISDERLEELGAY